MIRVLGVRELSEKSTVAWSLESELCEKRCGGSEQCYLSNWAGLMFSCNLEREWYFC